MEYKSHKVVPGTDPIAKSLEQVEVDSVNWRTHLTDGTNNYIKFLPFSEYHGGGGSYLINIGTSDFDSWISEHETFELEIRKMLEQ